MALERGLVVTGSELVGLVPLEAMLMAGKYFLQKQGISYAVSEKELVHIAIDKLGLSELYDFKPEEKIIEYMIKESGPLASMKISGFLSELSSKSPAPGGGSVAALSGSLGAALSSMVCNLTFGKEKYADVQDEIKQVLKKSEQLRKKLEELVDKDTEAFNDVMKAFKMPKETEEQKKKRSAAIQQGYKTAAQVPLETARVCAEILDLAKATAEKGNVNSITDSAVSALMAQAGVIGAILNVKINLGSIKDEEFVNKMSSELKKLEDTSKDKTEEILKIVESKM